MLKYGYNKSQLNKNKKDKGSISSKSDIHCDDLPHASSGFVYFWPAGSGLWTGIWTYKLFGF